MLRMGLKRTAQFVAVLLALPFAALTLFGRLQPVFTFFSHLFAIGPGLPGNFLRSAYYKLTLDTCSQDSNIAFGTYFVKRHSRVGSRVAIGAYCVVGGADIGAGTQVGSHVLIPGGGHQHTRNEDGSLTSCAYSLVHIGEQCWIGDGAILMADIGDHCTIGAGAVVTKPIPPGVVAVGNPARPIGRDTSIQPDVPKPLMVPTQEHHA